MTSPNGSDHAVSTINNVTVLLFLLITENYTSYTVTKSLTKCTCNQIMNATYEMRSVS